MSSQFDRRANDPTMPEPGVRRKPTPSALTVASREAAKTAQAAADGLERVNSLRAKLKQAEEALGPLQVAARGAEARYMKLRQAAIGASSDMEQAEGED